MRRSNQRGAAIGHAMVVMGIAFGALVPPCDYAQPSAPVKCGRPLTERAVRDLLAAQVVPVRVRNIVQHCGISFVFTSESEGRLRAGGATPELIEAIRALPVQRLASRNEPDLPIYARGVVMMNAYKNEDAIKAFEAAIRLRPNYPKAFYNRGVCYMRLGNLDRAIESFDEVLRQDSDNQPALLNRGTLYMKKFEATPEVDLSARKQFICAAVRDLRYALARNSEDVRVRNDLEMSESSLEIVGGQCPPTHEDH